MSENMENISVENAVEENAQYTVEYILSQIEKIRKSTPDLTEVLFEIKTIRSDGPEDTAPMAKAQAITEIVRCRETTNQQMLKLYEKMYDNLTTTKSSTQVELDKWNSISKLADVALHDDDFASERSEMLDSIRQILRENK